MISRKLLTNVLPQVGKRKFSTSKPCLLSSGHFDINDKAALVTGGASGIGYECCKMLLRGGVRGLTIADKNNDLGEIALREIAQEFGNDRAVFIQCDTTKSELLDWAFKTTLRAFNRLDIVVNCAGVLSDKVWGSEIETNVTGTMMGNLLGLQYITGQNTGNGGIIVNIASTMGLEPFGGLPIYSMTQAAILGLTRALGADTLADRTKVKVVGIAAGLTKTRMMPDAVKQTINSHFAAEFKREIETGEYQAAEDVAHTMIKAIQTGQSGDIWVVEHSSEPYNIVFPCYRSMCAIKAKSVEENELLRLDSPISAPTEENLVEIICNDEKRVPEKCLEEIQIHSKKPKTRNHSKPTDNAKILNYPVSGKREIGTESCSMSKLQECADKQNAIVKVSDPASSVTSLSESSLKNNRILLEKRTWKTLKIPPPNISGLSQEFMKTKTRSLKKYGESVASPKLISWKEPAESSTSSSSVNFVNTVDRKFKPLNISKRKGSYNRYNTFGRDN